METDTEYILPEWDKSQQETKGLQCPVSPLGFNDNTAQAENRVVIIPDSRTARAPAILNTFRPS